MNIIDKKIIDLVPYKNNSRIHDEKQVKQICESIKEFGFTSPILIDENNVIIAGHGRYFAMKKLKRDEVPCIVLSGLTEEQKKAYVIADNKLTMNGDWDIDILKKEFDELRKLDFDLELTGFDLDELDEIFDEDDEDDFKKPNERIRTNNAYNLDMFEVKEADGFYQMPIIKNDNFIPEDLIGFNYAKTSKNKNVGIHFYLDDYQFERVWNNPQEYIDILEDYDCILSPDFSLYSDMPIAMKIWNVYRSRLVGHYFQSFGIKVIPTISWAEKETYEFCFDGIPEGSVVSISTIGVKGKGDNFMLWKNGVDEMIKRIKPSAILVYGGEVDYNYGDIKVIYYNNKVTERWKENGNN